MRGRRIARCVALVVGLWIPTGLCAADEVLVPSVIGMKVGDAVDALQQLGLDAELYWHGNTDGPAKEPEPDTGDLVIFQAPGHDVKLSESEAVVPIRLSVVDADEIGDATTTPELTGLMLRSAAAEAAKQGLMVRVAIPPADRDATSGEGYIPDQLTGLNYLVTEVVKVVPDDGAASDVSKGATVYVKVRQKSPSIVDLKKELKDPWGLDAETIDTAALSDQAAWVIATAGLILGFALGFGLARRSRGPRPPGPDPDPVP